MHDLPYELILIIFEFAPDTNMPTLKLLCKDMANIVEHVMMQRCKGLFVESQLQEDSSPKPFGRSWTEIALKFHNKLTFCTTFDARQYHNNLSFDFSDNFQTVRTSAENWQPIRTNIHLPAIPGVQYEWEVTVLEAEQDVNSWKILVTVEVAELTVGCNESVLPVNTKNAWGYIWHSGGKVHENNQTQQYTSEPGSIGDVIKVQLVFPKTKSKGDCQITYFRNGKSLGQAFTIPASKYNGLTYRLTPGVSLYATCAVHLSNMKLIRL